MKEIITPNKQHEGIMRMMLRYLAALLLVAGIALPATAQEPEMQVYPQYIGATNGPDEQTGVVPTAFYVVITGLQPETEYYFGPSGGAYGFILDGTTATRGSRWRAEEGDWVSPSTVGPAGTTDAEGTLARWLYIRPPSSFDHADAYRVRLRIFPFPDTEAGHSWDVEFPTLTALQIHETAPDGFEGAWIYGNAGAEYENLVILAYESPEDERPLNAWMVRNHDIGQDGDRGHLDEDEFGTAGFFQLLVPAGAQIGKLEVRDENNNVVASQTSSAWVAGDAGTATLLNDQEEIVLAAEQAEPEATMLVYPQVVGATNGPEAQEGVVPTAFFVEVTGLNPGQEYYFGPSGGAYGLILDGTTATRGSRWRAEESDWVSPSTVGPAGTADEEGTLARWLYIRPPSNFDHADAYRVRLRIFPFPDTEGGFSWDQEFPTIRAVQIHETAPEGFEGAWIYGTVPEDYENHVIVAYENEEDERPLNAWMVRNHDIGQDGDRTHLDPDTLGTPGFFQLIVPANASIEKIEIRNDDNEVVFTQTSELWNAGAAGTAQNLNDQEAIGTAIEKIDDIPTTFALKQNYPNPFNPETRIEFTLSETAQVSLAIYNVLGQQVATLVDGHMTPGTYGYVWNGRSAEGTMLPSGTYIYQIRAGDKVESRTMLLIK